MKEKFLTVGELLEALSQFAPEDPVYVHAEMSMLVECPVIGVTRSADSAEKWKAVLAIKEMEEEDEDLLQAKLN
jgi:hypothetical protein